MGVMTTGPVSFVPITGPPCQISGGVPLAVSPALPAVLALLTLLALQPAWVLAALTMPPILPRRGMPVTLVVQELTDCCDDCGAASADVAAAVTVAVDAATKTNVARRQRRL